VKIKSDMLVVARGYYDGRYDDLKIIPYNSDSFMVAVRNLPRECDRNPFRLTIADVAARRDIFAEQFVWSSGVSARGLQWDVPVSSLKSSGGVEFQLKLYSGNEDTPILARDFALEVPKQ
jgi:hypothetical protein